MAVDLLGWVGIGAVAAITAGASALLFRRIDRRRREERLLAIRRLERVLDSLADSVVIVGPDQNVRYCNARCERLFGRPVSQLLDKPFPIAASAGDSVETQIVRPNGDLIEVELQSTEITYKKECCVLVSLRDISARVRDARLLRESELKFRQAFFSAGNGILLVQLDHRIFDANETAAELLRRTTADLVGANIETIVDASERDKIIALLDSLASQGSVAVHTETLLTASEEGNVAVALSAGLVRDEMSSPQHFVIHLTDLSSLKEMEAKYLQAQKMESVGNLTGGIAHDFNNILGVIIGNLELLQQRLPNAAEHSKMIDAAMNSARRAAGLTRQLLAFSRQQALSVEPSDVNRIVGNVIGMLERTVDANIEIETDLDPGVGLVSVDQAQLESAIFNLCINARDAMPKGGRLSVATSACEPDETDAARHGDENPDRQVCISVTDTGTGMSKDILNEIFDPFFTTKEVGKGTGLGLSMVHGFVKQSKGHIDVESEPGRGTRFRIYLPRIDTDERDHVSAPIDNGSVQGGTETILLVEDDPDIREITSLQLESLGYTVLTANNPDDAFSKLDDLPSFDLLMSDVVMPGHLNGQEFADEVVAKFPGAAVLLSSGYPKGAFADGVRYPFLQKPYDHDDLARTVRQCLRKPGN